MWKRLVTIALCLLLATPLWAAVPAFRSVGVIGSKTGAGTPALPTGTTTNDIILLFIETDDEAATLGGTPTDVWTEIADSPQSVTNETRLTAFWSRASQATPTMPSINDAGNHIIYAAMSFSGAITTGDPWDVTSGGTEAVSDTTGSITGDTTTVDDCMIVAVMATDLPDANDPTSSSAEANGDLTSVTSRLDSCKNSGNGGCLFFITGELATAGSYGATTLTLEDAAQKAFMTIALKPPAAPVGGRRVMVVD